MSQPYSFSHSQDQQIEQFQKAEMEQREMAKQLSKEISELERQLNDLKRAKSNILRSADGYVAVQREMKRMKRQGVCIHPHLSFLFAIFQN